MQTKTPVEPTGSPVPGIIPEPVRAHAGTAVVRPASRTTEPAWSPRRRNPARIVLASLLSAIRGDKYMVDAYEPAWSALMARRAAATVVRAQHPGGAARRARSAGASQPVTAEGVAPAVHTKER